ncbi:hypothetical protein L3X38_032626 [Prunus dulcis]|uniref:Uncharacterized protein n=1 Tax=Prunus dulcis TaxID=3755 RepID=A0AAD4VFT5_PRUDU|nr:hypothetical protein L3X38_032626 [Prunus dulcis]
MKLPSKIEHTRLIYSLSGKNFLEVLIHPAFIQLLVGLGLVARHALPYSRQDWLFEDSRARLCDAWGAIAWHALPYSRQASHLRFVERRYVRHC